MLRILIRIGSAFDGRLGTDPGGGGLKSAKMKEKNAAKRQIVRHKKYKKQCN
jgi:hypothetical protein